MPYGTGIVLIILIGTLLSDLTQVKDSCFWMCISAAVIAPITWEDLQHFIVQLISEDFCVSITDASYISDGFNSGVNEMC